MHQIDKSHSILERLQNSSSLFLRRHSNNPKAVEFLQKIKDQQTMIFKSPYTKDPNFPFFTNLGIPSSTYSYKEYIADTQNYSPKTFDAIMNQLDFSKFNAALEQLPAPTKEELAMLVPSFEYNQLNSLNTINFQLSLYISARTADYTPAQIRAMLMHELTHAKQALELLVNPAFQIELNKINKDLFQKHPRSEFAISSIKSAHRTYHFWQEDIPQHKLTELELFKYEAKRDRLKPGFINSYSAIYVTDHHPVEEKEQIGQAFNGKNPNAHIEFLPEELSNIVQMYYEYKNRFLQIVLTNKTDQLNSLTLAAQDDHLAQYPFIRRKVRLMMRNGYLPAVHEDISEPTLIGKIQNWVTQTLGL